MNEWQGRQQRRCSHAEVWERDEKRREGLFAMAATALAKCARFVYTMCTEILQEQAVAGQLIHVGVREFREGLAQYLESPNPVAITRHGQTVGYFVPAKAKVDEAELVALRQAVEQLEALLTEHGITEDEVVREFRARRAQS
jgi:antitoxin (DNA-binding transcriptional repressor) of toxin-antitoxin stability system